MSVYYAVLTQTSSDAFVGATNLMWEKDIIVVKDKKELRGGDFQKHERTANR